MRNSYLVSSLIITVSTAYLILNIENISSFYLIAYIIFFLLVLIKLFLKLHDFSDIINRVLEVSYNCIFIKDREGRYKLANRALMNLYGVKRNKDIIGKTDTELAEKGFISRYEALRCKDEDLIVQSAKKSKTFPVNEFRSINGSTHIYQVIKTPFNSIKSRNNIIGISIDITQRRKIESELHKSEIRNKMLIESSPYGTIVADHNGQIISFNSRIKEVTGYNISDINNINDFFLKISETENDIILLLDEYEQIHQKIKSTNRNTSLITKHGCRKYINLSLSLLPNDNTAVFIKDITTEVEVENKIIEAKNNERRRIVTEIHDIVGHSLISLFMMTEAAKEMIGLNNDKAMDLVNHASIQIQNSMLDLKMVLKMLENIDENDSFGLDNLKKLIIFFEKLTDVSISLNISDNISEYELDRCIDRCFYRIIQEAMTNAVKHGKAGKIDIDIHINNSLYILKICNDGTVCRNYEQGIGLRGIDDRVTKLDGVIDIECSESCFILKVKVSRDKMLEINDE